MKNSLIIICVVLTTFSLTAFGFKMWDVNETDQAKTSCNKSKASKNEISKKNQAEPEFFYEVDSRFNARITKEKLRHAKSIIDLVPRGATRGIESFKEVKIRIDSQAEEMSEMGDSVVLTTAQLNLLQSIDYSTNFIIEAF